MDTSHGAIEKTEKILGMNISLLDEGEGPPLLLVHGGGSKLDWRANLEPLSRRFRVVAPDLPGFGRSDKPERDYTLEFYDEFLGALVRHLGVARIALVGHSMGGLVAARFAVMRPDVVERLVLVAPMGFGREIHPAIRLMQVPILGALLQRPSPSGTRRLLETLIAKRELITEDLVRETLELQSQPGAARAFASIFGALVRPLRGVVAGVPEAIASLGPRTMVVWGREDALLPCRHLDVARERLPGGRFLCFEGCGHFPQLEDAARFDAEVGAFAAPGA
jgi:pimeloyl-ACP methyl ester carboxylesterase